MTQEEDVREVRAEEERRGRSRRPVDTEAKKKARRLRNDLENVLRTGDERRFLMILREAGLKDGTPEFAKALKLFREESGRP